MFAEHFSCCCRRLWQPDAFWGLEQYVMPGPLNVCAHQLWQYSLQPDINPVMSTSGYNKARRTSSIRGGLVSSYVYIIHLELEAEQQHCCCWKYKSSYWPLQWAVRTHLPIIDFGSTFCHRVTAFFSPETCSLQHFSLDTPHKRNKKTGVFIKPYFVWMKTILCHEWKFFFTIGKIHPHKCQDYCFAAFCPTSMFHMTIQESI